MDVQNLQQFIFQYLDAYTIYEDSYGLISVKEAISQALSEYEMEQPQNTS